MPDMKLREAYFKALGAEPGEVNKSKTCAALVRAHEYRTLEIELYWKRATYYWAFQAAVFAAFGLILSRDRDSNQWMAVLILCVAGIVTACTGLLAAKGSKFWQNNWEKQVDMLEAEFEGNLHKTVWLQEAGKRPYSVTKLNEALSIGLIVIWVILLVVTIYRSWPREWTICFVSEGTLKLIAGGFLVVGLAIPLFFLFRAKSDLSGWIFEESGSHWQVFPGRRRHKLQGILRRIAAGEVWTRDGPQP